MIEGIGRLGLAMEEQRERNGAGFRVAQVSVREHLQRGN